MAMTADKPIPVAPPPSGPADARAALMARLPVGAVVTSELRAALGAVLDEDLAAQVGGRATLAEVALRARQDVLQIVTHDLRGPLSAITVAADAFRDPAIAPGERDRYAQAIAQSCRRADQLLCDLLDVVAIEAHELQVACRLVAVRAVLEEVARENEALVKAYGRELHIYVDAHVSTAWIDRERMVQALSHLVRTTLKHARGALPVELDAIPLPHGGTCLVVRFRGPGMAPPAMARLQERLWQQRSPTGGGGLGLAIARGVAEAHGGALRIYNEPSGGMRFEIELVPQPAAA